MQSTKIFAVGLGLIICISSSSKEKSVLSAKDEFRSASNTKKELAGPASRSDGTITAEIMSGESLKVEMQYY